MEIVLRILMVLMYWIGTALEPIVKLFFQVKREKVTDCPDEILNLSVKKLIEKLKFGELSSEELVVKYIKRINQVNPIINAVIEDRFSDAIQEARDIDKLINSVVDKDALFQSHKLLGVPFTVKEACGVKGLSQTVGSHYRKGVKTGHDSEVVSLLKEAGAIPLLVSANPELCVSWETYTLTHGRCLNPYNTECTAGGSSGGEGALNGAGATAFGIGSDLCGSVRIPALFNGVFGHKPTGGLVSTNGHFPNIFEDGFNKILQLGPMTRFAEDLSLLLDVMAGKHAHKLIQPTGITNMKIFYMDAKLKVTALPVSKSITNLIHSACTYFSSHGNKVEKLDVEEMNDAFEIIATKLLRFNPPRVHENPGNPEFKTTMLTEIIKHLKGRPIHSFHALYFQFLNDISVFFPAFKTNHYLDKCESLKNRLKAVLAEDGVLLYPTFHRPAFSHNTSIIHSGGTGLAGLFNTIGFPAVHVPMGLDENGLPIGIQVIAAPYADRNCFQVAIELEKAFGGWIAPS